MWNSAAKYSNKDQETANFSEHLIITCDQSQRQNWTTVPKSTKKTPQFSGYHLSICVDIKTLALHMFRYFALIKDSF